MGGGGGARKAAAAVFQALPPARRAAAGAPRVLVLAGPTGVGKTAVSLELAGRLGGEVVSADSVQVYRGLDVGSAKLGVGDRRGVPHHLMDVLEPERQYTAADFSAEGRKAVQGILDRGGTPLVVGGTGMWLRWFVHGRSAAPGSAPEARAAAEERLRKAYSAAAPEGSPNTPEVEDARWAAAAAVLAKAGDPETAARLNRNDFFRLSRALEVVERTGRPLKELDIDFSTPLDYDFRCFFLYPEDRVALARTIDARCVGMLRGGLLEEARDLVLMDPPPGKTARSAIGYRQAADYLERCAAEAARSPGSWEPDWDAFRDFAEGFCAASRRLAQDQFTWFKKDPMYLWVKRAAGEDPAQTAELIAAEFSKDSHGAEDMRERLQLSKEKARELRCYRPDLSDLASSEARSSLLQKVKLLVKEIVGSRERPAKVLRKSSNAAPPNLP